MMIKRTIKGFTFEKDGKEKEYGESSDY